tara:strand:- start:113 stop:385 length:273 start_codon:yes stop_codon:yes gene_type:complete
MYEHIRELEIRDSLNTVHIQTLEDNLKSYELLLSQKDDILNQQDSLIILIETKYDLCEKRLKEVEPSIFDNKYLWFIYGFLTKNTIESIK